MTDPQTSRTAGTQECPGVVVFGECLVDRFVDAAGGKAQAIAGGAPFNVARHLALLGFEPVFITRLGRDAEGMLLRGELERCGVGTTAVQWDAQHPSGQVLVHLQGGGHRFEILANQAYDYIDATALPVLAPQAQPRWLYFGTLIQRSEPNRAALAALRARLPHRAFVDLNWRAGQVTPELALGTLAAADVLKVSGEELALLLAWRQLRSDHIDRPPAVGTPCPGIGALLAGQRTQGLIVTHGAAGYALWDGAGLCQVSGGGLALAHIADTVGAGDAFSSLALAGLLRGWPMAQTLALANAFAAAICGVRGAVPVDPAFYAHWRSRAGTPAMAGP